MVRIALVGRSGAGKTTIASFLHDNYGFAVCSTGLRCRVLAREFFGTESKLVLNQVTDAMRRIDPAIWLKLALRQLSGEETKIVIDSARFWDDYLHAKSRGFVVWRIECPTEIRLARLASRGQQYSLADEGHRAEWELDSVAADSVVDNSGCIEALASVVSGTLQLLDEQR